MKKRWLMSLILSGVCVLMSFAAFTSCHRKKPAVHTHSWGAWTEVTAPTCTESGEEERVCKGNSTHRETREIEAKGHTPKTVRENEVVATCTAEGGYDEVVYCEICNEKLSSEHKTVEKLPHTYEGVVTEPTCIQQGYTTYTCTECGDRYTGDVVAATGHTPKAAVKENEVPATCTAEGGYDEVVYCEICNEKLSSEYKTVEKLSHTYEGVVTAPTCTQQGYTTYTCTECGDRYTGDVVAATGHTPKAAVRENEVPATCTAEGGYDEVIYCKTCNEKLSSEHKTVAKIAHNYASVVTQATCTEGGYTTYTCKVCGYSYTGNVVAAKGHSYVNGFCRHCGEQKPSEGLNYTLNSDRNSYSVTGIGTCTDTDLVITSTYNGKPVTVIGEYAFSGCGALTSVTISDSMTSIGAWAFKDCNKLTAVYYRGDIVSWCNISFDYPYSNPLEYAHNLYINDQLVTDLKIPDSVRGIKNYAFKGCTSLTSLTSGKGLTSIGDNAFQDCTGLTKVTIENNVTSIGYGAFGVCRKLTAVYYRGDIASWCNISFGGYESNPLSNGAELYINNALIRDLKIPGSVREIKNSVFHGCTSLTSIVIPNSVTSIGGSAFYNCTSLTSVTIPGSVTSIGGSAFRNCSKLTSLTIPGSVTSIGEQAFYACSSLTSITLGNKVTSIGYGAFFNCTSLTSVTIPDGVTSIGYNEFYNCSSLTSITIGNSVTSIEVYAFYNCSSLTTINFKGTKAQWQAIEKGVWWDYNTGNYTVYCTDGTI